VAEDFGLRERQTLAAQYKSAQSASTVNAIVRALDLLKRGANRIRPMLLILEIGSQT
jgi:hypothetical protein